MDLPVVRDRLQQRPTRPTAYHPFHWDSLWVLVLEEVGKPMPGVGVPVHLATVLLKQLLTVSTVPQGDR